ncbi:MAG TPA: hypothetical protein VEK39_04265 [Solirubrobacterales bacterium]|nr:hypothetical protein [Solirubrobacterales bacterium]
MSALAASSMFIVLAGLAAVAFGPSVARGLLERLPRRRRAEVIPAYDPGRERRAERRARELMRSVVGPEDCRMYEDLGFLRVLGPTAAVEQGGYGYLIYPHRPIVAFDAESGELLSEYCVAFPDGGQPRGGERLPDADDVLAKWMALHGDEHGLIADANMHLVGRQVDPQHVRRDLRRLAEWEAQRMRPQR